MPTERSYAVRLHTGAVPTQVWANDQPVARGDGERDWRYDREARAVCLTVSEDRAKLSPEVVRFQGVA
jgi:hypothetical protein